MLAACSEYFRTLFTSKLAASPSLRAGIVDVDLEAAVLKKILAFMYTGQYDYLYWLQEERNWCCQQWVFFPNGRIYCPLQLGKDWNFVERKVEYPLPS